MAERHFLHIKHLDEFRDYLASRGYLAVPLSRNEYEVLRMKRNKDTVIVFKKNGAKEHLSVMDKDIHHVRCFYGWRKNKNQETDDLLPCQVSALEKIQAPRDFIPGYKGQRISCPKYPHHAERLDRIDDIEKHEDDPEFQQWLKQLLIHSLCCGCADKCEDYTEGAKTE